MQIKVPLLITMDLEIAYDHDIKMQREVLLKLNSDLKDNNLPITFFSTSTAIDEFRSQIKELIDSGHEIGNHGIKHDKSENYKTLDSDKINYYINKSTENINRKIGVAPKCFRGPYMSTSSVTQQVLFESGYLADFSVCSQRIDIINSKGGCLGWIVAPRGPYYPSYRSPFFKGSRQILVIPLSCFGLPYMSGLLYLFGLQWMKQFFKFFLIEAKRTNRPIVYLFHSYEFTDGIHSIQNKPFLIKENIEVKRSLIHKFYKKDPKLRYDLNFELLKYMISFDCIIPVTGSRYIESYKKEISEKAYK